MKNNILTLVIFSIFSMSFITAQDDCFYSFIYSIDNESVSIEIENINDVYGVSFTLDGQTMYSPSDILSLSLSSVIQPVNVCAEFYSPSCDEIIQICQLVDISFLINFSTSDGCTDITLIDPNSDCNFVYDPVCGCNGITYINSCEATNYGGVISWILGPCETSDSDDDISNENDTGEEEEYDEDDNGWWHGDWCDEECDGNCSGGNNDDSDDDEDLNNDQIEEGCYDVNGVLYGLGDTYEYSEEFCENYTCVYWFGYQFVQNWEVYPSCQQTDDIISGCTILEACNFNPNANQNDGTCDFISCLSLGCTDINACNYDPSAEYEDGSCVYPEFGFDCDEEIEGCFNDNGSFYSVGSEWFISDCEFFVCEGENNWSEIQILEDCLFDCDVEIMLSQSSENSCLFEFSLMTDSEFIGSDGSLLAEIVWDFGDGNIDFESGMQTQHVYELSGIYNVTATYWNSSCGLSTISTSLESINCGECILDSDSDGICDDFEILGCTIFGACNYNPDATESDNSLCDFISCLLLGCTDPFACNYDPTADYEDGSCEYPEIGFDCEEEFEGCYNDNGSFYSIGTEWFVTDCEFFVCEGQNSWSDINILDDCLGCTDDFGVFYSLGQELFLDSSGCAFIFCETPNNWSDIIIVPNCNGLGCYDANGNLYLNNEELIISDNDCDNLTCIQSDLGFEFVSNFELYPDCNSIDCNFTIEASSQDDVPCDLNWLFQINGLLEETDNIFWDFGDGTSGDASWVTEHIYETDGVYSVTAFVFTPLCQLVTVVTEIIVEGCEEEEIGCFDNSGVFYGIGSEWYLTECEYIICESPGNWSDVNILDNCLGCFDDFGVFYNLGSELFLSEDSCSFIFCESPGSWSEVIEIPDCAGAGCYSEDGVFYNVGEEMYLNECEYTFCESSGNWSDIQIITGCDIDCNFSIEASSQDDVPCNLNWLFQLNGLEEETDNIFWDFGDGTSGDASWVTEHTYETDGIYLVTAFVFTPYCQLVTVVTEIIVEGCDVELGCYDNTGNFYNPGEVLEISDDFCENSTCSSVDTIGLEFSFIPNWELYPDCYQEECVNLDQINVNLPCPFVYAPVCGCNGMTYNNECEAFFYGGVTDWSDGPCEDGGDDCEIFFEWFINPNGVLVAEAYGYPEGTEISWYIDGDLYVEGDNVIEYNMNNLFEPVSLCLGGETEDCGGFEYCELIYPAINEYGCHEGGVFYPVGSIIYLNECEYVMCEWVDTWSDVMEIEDCGDDECIDESVIDPELGCYEIWAPVCGCDGVTYANDCYAYYYHGVTEWTEGECGGSEGECTIDVDGWYQGGFGMFEAYNYPEGVNLHWWINGELYEDDTPFIEVDNLEYYGYYEDVVDICVGYATEDCGEVYECMQITLDGDPENPCPLELWSGVEDGIAMFEAYDYPEGVYLFWMVNGEIIENQGHYLEIDMNLIDVDFLDVCVGYESPDCPYGVYECTVVEVDDNSGGGDDECDGSIEVIPPKWDMCQWAFALEGVDENCSVTWDFGDGNSGPGSTWEAYYYQEDGTYIVTATYYTEECPEGVTLVVTIQVEGCDTSVDEVVDGANWSVYPVPTSYNISLRGLPAGTWSAKLFDSTGRVVLQSDVSNGSQLDVNQLRSGMYTMQIVGLTTSAKRVVVQR